jgi:hypothetical protein
MFGWLSWKRALLKMWSSCLYGVAETSIAKSMWSSCLDSAAGTSIAKKVWSSCLDGFAENEHCKNCGLHVWIVWQKRALQKSVVFMFGWLSRKRALQKSVVFMFG